MNRSTKIALIIGTLIMLIIGGSLLMNQQQTEYWEDGHMMMGFSNWSGLMMAFMIVFWSLVIWGIIWLIRNFTQSGQDVSDSNNSISAFELLKRRYAGGEIDREEFEAKRRELI